MSGRIEVGGNALMKQMAATSELASSHSEAVCQIHPNAVLDPSVQLAEGVRIHANAVIEKGVRVGRGAVIHAGCYVGEDCVIGEGAILYQFVTLREKTRVGDRVVIESGVVIGSDGFGYAKEESGVNYKVPQVGYVVIRDGVHIGPNTTIDRATLGITEIEAGAEIGALVQVGHNVVVGPNSRVGDGTGICGSCKIGSNVAIGQSVGMVGHIRIGDGARVKDGAGISKDVHDGTVMVGSPAMEQDRYAVFQQYIDELADFSMRLGAIEKQLDGS
ncbi:MAG: UDP-3-O-(3-hydroxymyristoyl)glucosamine N-acyltransferase [bacterium]|nr:UDP-3-O-(3-hydroxymyristoyl)glucosamine N-acyltransferase [bacterium]